LVAVRWLLVCLLVYTVVAVGMDLTAQQRQQRRQQSLLLAVLGAVRGVLLRLRLDTMVAVVAAVTVALRSCNPVVRGGDTGQGRQYKQGVE
jgi:hypothetical protein